ncbi:glycosyltransferase family 2 protein [Ohtaekwangia sp.]|uniref:glycosyltransferase family 2 protein n=1 Tax=Ohtaekwangia sp. TaxID=2066019 RepID=UPI002F9427EA
MSVEVSVIIINYNTFSLTCQCIDSVMQQTQNVVYEIIVVDNASTEINPQEFKNRYHDKIRLVTNASNIGFAAGNNAGIEYARGKFILLLNSDTVLKNNAILLCMQRLEVQPLTAAISARLEYPDGTVQHCCQRFPSVKYKLMELMRLQKFVSKRVGGRWLLGSFFDHNEFIYPDWIWGTFFMFPKAMLQLLPGNKLADDFFMYGEDIQWCKEFSRLGYRVAFNPEARVVHYVGKSGGARHAMMDQNMSAFMNKYYSLSERSMIKFLDSILIRS